jgi:hypothetical protein
MTTDNFYFYLHNRLIQTSQTGSQWYNDTSPFSIPWFSGTGLTEWNSASLFNKSIGGSSEKVIPKKFSWQK